MTDKYHEGFKRDERQLSTDRLTTRKCHGIRYIKARDAIHRLDGIRYIATGYGTPISRDTIHVFRGIRYIGFTGYGT